MLNRFFGEKTHLNLHLLGLSGIAAGISFNKVVMSVSMMFIVLNLLLEGNYKQYWKNIKTNKIYLLILGFFLLHVLGLLWTNNFDYAFHDLNTKLPLLVIPTILAAKPILERKHLDFIAIIFTGTVLFFTLLNFALYQHWIGNIVYDDIRGLSHFSSHVRFSLLVSMTIGITLYFFNQVGKSTKAVLSILLLWLIFYTLYSTVISGFITMMTVFVVYWVFAFYSKSKWIAFSPIVLGLISFVALIVWLMSPVTFDYSKIDFNERTSRGHLYRHNCNVISPETNEPLLHYICEEELRTEWSNYSSIPIDSTDRKGQKILSTIIRYLASKHLRKDADGLAQLNQKDISNIENGITSASHHGLLGRLYGVKYQLINNSNPNGHSLLQRLEYWKTGVEIAQKNLILGVGTGDVQDSFDEQYEEDNSPLNIEKRNRAHNYYLTILITFGLAGLLYFLLIFYQFIRFNALNKEVLAIAFIFIILVSFLIEDTIETQTGVTFFALFYGLFSVKYPALKKKLAKDD